MQHFHPMIFFENIKGEKYFCINLSVTEEMSTCRLQSGVHTDLGYFCKCSTRQWKVMAAALGTTWHWRS